jgi:hypothetical protein
MQRRKVMRILADNGDHVVYAEFVQPRKVWTEEKIRELLWTSDIAVDKAILRLYSHQTSDEQQCGETKHTNGIGFSGAHARSGAYYAKWCLSGRRLSGNHLAKARQIALHYVGQLTKVANGKL